MNLFNIVERLSNLQHNGLLKSESLGYLPSVQINALYYLSICNHYSNTPGAVTEYLGLTKGTVSQSLQKLEEQGLIVRNNDLKDKRKVRLTLTQKARNAIDDSLSNDCISKMQTILPDNGLLLRSQLLELLRSAQRVEGRKFFGECHACRYHQLRNGTPFCGLTLEPIPVLNISLICREFDE